MNQDKSQQSKRNIDNETPSPTCRSQIPSQNRSETISHTPDNRKSGIILGVVFQGDFIGEDNFADDEETGAPGSLESATGKEHGECGGWSGGTEGAAEEHDDESGLHGWVAAKDVGALAPEGDEGCCCECECRDDPI